MARLNAALIDRAKAGKAAPGRYRDGNGLMLVVGERGASWVLRFQLNNARRDMGLGSVKHLGLAQARSIAQARRADIRVNRVDPLADRATQASQRRSITFNAASTAYINAHAAGWRDPRARKTWESTLVAYASPTIGKAMVRDITTEHVLEVLTPIWSRIPETATRVRGRVEAILDWAKVQHYRDGENPARWRGNLMMLLPAKAKVKKATKHHPAVPLADLPKVCKRLAVGAPHNVAAQATLFCIATAARPSEAARAQWSEIDFATKTWTVPPERTKGYRKHRVPLSPAVVAILQDMAKLRSGRDQRIFPSAKKDSFVSLSSMREALRQAGGGAASVHGTSRAAFDDFCHEHTSFPSKLVDYSLAHYPKERTEAAYRRADLLEKRRAVMERWAEFICGR